MTRDATIDRDRNRFEIPLEEADPATLDYEIPEDGVLDLKRTFVPEEARGEGVASDLVRQALEWARDHGYEVIPTCSFVEDYIDRHDEWRGIVRPS